MKIDDKVFEKAELMTNAGEISHIKLANDLVAGKWKILILWYLREKNRRFRELNRLLSAVSRGVLTQQLKQLESDKLIHREVYTEVPLKVVYSLTDEGQSFSELLDVMRKWEELYIEKNKDEDKVD